VTSGLGYQADGLLAALTPDPTRAVVTATEVARKFASPSMFAHAQRSYLWGASYAVERGLAYDQELYYVAAILHDLGLEEPFDSCRMPFEVAGGFVAWVFAAGAGWPVDRRDRAAEIIVQHMGNDVTAADDPESHLLQVATTLDISGRGIEQWPADVRHQVLRTLPRGDLADAFLACFRGQADRKPESAAAAALRSGLADRISSNPLEARRAAGDPS
jgi:hypothetical protein